MVSKTWYLGRSFQVLDAEIEERLPDYGVGFTREALTFGCVRYRLHNPGVDLGRVTLHRVDEKTTYMDIDEPDSPPEDDPQRAAVLACQERVIQALCDGLNRPGLRRQPAEKTVAKILGKILGKRTMKPTTVRKYREVYKLVRKRQAATKREYDQGEGDRECPALTQKELVDILADFGYPMNPRTLRTILRKGKAGEFG